MYKGFWQELSSTLFKAFVCAVVVNMFIFTGARCYGQGFNEYVPNIFPEDRVEKEEHSCDSPICEREIHTFEYALKFSGGKQKVSNKQIVRMKLALREAYKLCDKECSDPCMEATHKPVVDIIKTN